ncbi:MAG: SDR family oxidoreductase [Myxococcota bacterium]
MTTTVVTGANRGIGLALCQVAKARGHEVIALCRAASDELAALDVRIEEGIDISDDSVIGLLPQRLAGVSIDVLVNNAGVMSRERLDDMDLSRIRRQFEVNSLGPLRVTTALLPSLGPGSKVAIVTSRMGSIADNNSGGSYGYRMSKAAVNAAGVSLARDLVPRKIAVLLLHPGWIRTGLTEQKGNADAPEAAAGLWAQIDALTLETSGSFRHANGESLPW